MPTLKTAADHHLDVAPHKRDWTAVGPFYDRVVDSCDLAFIHEHLKSRFDAVAFEVIEDRGYASWIIFEPDHKALRRAIRGFVNQIENGEHLDEMAIEEAIDALVNEEWEGCCFAQRLHYLFCADAHLGLALSYRVPAAADGMIRECLYESDLI